MKSQQKEERLSQQLLFGLVLFDSKEASNIEEAIDSLLKIDYPSGKLKIIVSSHINKNPNVYINYINTLLEKFKHTRLLMNHGLETKTEVEHNAFSLCQHANYLVKMNMNQEIPSDFFVKINENITKKDTVLVYNDLVALPYKLVSRNYLLFNDYDKTSDKLIEKSKQDNLFKNIK